MVETDSMVLFHGQEDWPSQWYLASFVVDQIRYNCAEQFMMAEKARFFRDRTALTTIMAAKSPRAQKAVGRTVRGFDERRWAGHARGVVFTGTIAKFDQNPDLKTLLLATELKVIAEASPSDRIWGIGLGCDDPRAHDRSAWRGTNWLGEELMRARSVLRGSP